MTCFRRPRRVMMTINDRAMQRMSAMRTAAEAFTFSCESFGLYLVVLECWS